MSNSGGKGKLYLSLESGGHVAATNRRDHRKRKSVRAPWRAHARESNPIDLDNTWVRQAPVIR
jgi:hypothetical protein